MSHGIISSSTNIPGFWYADDSTGFHQYGYNTLLYGHTFLPASTSNPKTGQFRQPANWYNRTARWTWSEGDVLLISLADRTQWQRTYGQMLALPYSLVNSFPLLSTTLEYDLIREALASLTQDNVQFNAALLQAKGTFKMVGDLATGLAHGTETLMSRRFPKGPKQWRKFLAKGSRKALRKFSGKYLEFLYGWKPLADDITNALEQMDANFQRDRNVFKFRLRKKRTIRGTYTLSSNVSMYFRSNLSWSQKLISRQTSTISLIFEFPEWYQENIPVVSPFGTLWEIAPWSFVVDWALPIGDWIGAMESFQWSPYFRGGSRSTFHKVESSRQLQPSMSPREWGGWDTRVFQTPGVNGYCLSFDRKVIRPEDLIDIIRFPSMRSPLSYNHAQQGIALLTQVFQRWFSGGRLDTPLT